MGFVIAKLVSNTTMAGAARIGPLHQPQMGDHAKALDVAKCATAPRPLELQCCHKGRKSIIPKLLFLEELSMFKCHGVFLILFFLIDRGECTPNLKDLYFIGEGQKEGIS